MSYKIALCGKPFTGVTHVAHYLSNIHKAAHISMSELLLLEYAAANALPFFWVLERKSSLRKELSDLAIELGMHDSIDMFRPQLSVAEALGKGVVIEKIRTRAQAEQIKGEGYTLVELVSPFADRAYRARMTRKKLDEYDREYEDQNLCSCIERNKLLLTGTVSHDADRLLELYG